MATVLTILLCSQVGFISAMISMAESAPPSINQQFVQSANVLHSLRNQLNTNEGAYTERLEDSIESSEGDNLGSAGELAATKRETSSAWMLPRQQRQQSDAYEHSDTDWWMKLTHEPAHLAEYSINKPESNMVTMHNSGRDDALAYSNRLSGLTRSPGHRVQQNSWNTIQTVRNQFYALKLKHQLLVKDSIRQLQQLDQKLIYTYKLCFKRNMPLYAGMLYRTRDFVAKMAREVERERSNLESLGRKVLSSWQLLMTNKTLLKEYAIYRNSQEELESGPRVYEQEVNLGEEDISRAPIGSAVHIDGISIRRELDNTETLAERINRSSQEITAVVDDIINLFKLNKPMVTTSGRLNKMDRRHHDRILDMYSSNGDRNWDSPDQRTSRMLLKSPIQILWDKFGRATTESIPSSITGFTTVGNSIANPTENIPLDKGADSIYYSSDITLDKEFGFEIL